jgi:hypothetical protein
MSLHQNAAQTTMRNGVEFTLLLIEPGLWRWRFQIGETATTGKTKTNLRGLATRRVQAQIDRALRDRVKPAFSENEVRMRTAWAAAYLAVSF